MNARDTYLAEMAARLHRRIPADRPAFTPVDAVLAGRRDNPPEPEIGVPPLAVFNPIHYQELPELFMDFICSLTGKSPSTTGFGSEGALTKGPFNAVWPVVDLNNALRLGHPHRLRRLHHRGRARRPALPRGSRHQPAGARDLVPDAPAERDPACLIAGGLPREGGGLRARREQGAGQPPRLSHHLALRRPLPGPDLRDAQHGLHRGNAPARAAGLGRLRRRRGRHRRGPDAGGAQLLRGRQRRGRLPAAAGAAAHHGPRPVRGDGP